jgi:Tol biopolymer transport system component
MSLAAGTRLGPYEIQAPIGAGGMGEVYRALDTRLDRLVAIKVLPPQLANDPTALARFEREAKAVAALSHPHILAIHDVGREGTTSYAVMELLDGETLRERLDRDRLPPRKAFDYAIQSARALSAAHARGIVHRDLKPENIFVATDGHVKVLDFGLARVHLDANAQITAAPATSPGTVLGTVGYMSPEQVRGTHTDHRSDIFSLGVVLYEMLTGCRAFQRETSAETMTAILKEDAPQLSSSGVSASLAAERIIRRCLEKSPSERFHSAHDLGLALETISAESPSAPATVARAAVPVRRLALVPWIVAVLATAVAAWAVWRMSSTPPPAPRTTTRALIDLPPDTNMWLGRGSSVALSQRGDRLAYVAMFGGTSRLFLRALDRFESTALPGTEGAANPFFSPDGQWVGFTADGKLKKIAIDGGRAVTICEARNLRGEAWASDDTILLTPNGATGIWRVSAAGGTPEQLTRPAEGELSHRWPQALPDGRRVLYTIWNDAGFDAGRIAVRTIGADDQRILVQGGGYGRVFAVDDGAYLVYAHDEGLLAAPIDLVTLTLTGRAVPIVDRVITNLSGGAHFSVSGDGSLAYLPGVLGEVNKVLLSIDRSGKSEQVAMIPGLSFTYRIAPDGRRLARINSQGADRDVWIDDLQRGTTMRLTFGGHHFSPIWTPDGRRVIYTAGLPNGNLHWKSADGSGREEPLATSPNMQRATSVSPDGRTLVFVENDPGRAADIWTMSLEGDRTPRPFLQTPFAEGTAMISPDGRWLAFQSNESGRFEVYVAPFPAGGTKFQVSTNGGFQPLWSPDGRELFYQFDARMHAVAIEPTAQLTTGAPRTLFTGVYQGEGDLTRDGRFLLIKPTDQEAAPKTISLVLDWFDELQAKVPLR